MKILRCGRCPAAAERRMDKGMEVDPAGWEDLMLSGHPARHWRLCPGCVKSLVQFVGAINRHAYLTPGHHVGPRAEIR